MNVRDKLGYSQSARFYAPEQADDLPANELSFALRIASTECSKLGPNSNHARFEGAYVLQSEPQAPAVPVVYVVRCESEAISRQIHRFVWNQNQTPFLIVESPQSIRIYPGFAFDRDRDQPLIDVAKGAAEALEALSAFRAESIDNGTLWEKWSTAVDPSKRVDEALLRDLEALDKRLQKAGVDRTASHGLIGKYVYLRYLRDRGILSTPKLTSWNINPDHVFTRNATLKAFHKVDRDLQGWLNGSVFSFSEAQLTDITQPQLRLVAGVFCGDSPVGDSAVQTSLFDSYNFSQIPIETLSCVYEQFLHDAQENDGNSRGKSLGAYYTPLPLADYVLSELERRRPLKPGMTVLDPACGSGAFLVQSYRRLVERQRRSEGRELKKRELRDLLTKHIFGIDRDDDACRVAELSLIMTLLDYVEPPDLENTTFKLPCLRDTNIFQGDFFGESGPIYELLAEQRFDWIAGNPPWAEVKGTPAKDHEHFVAYQWMQAHKAAHPTSGNQIAEAFLWKAGESLTADGVCGLVVLAMTWFKKEGKTFRQQFFSRYRVWCLSNFSNLAYVLFAGRSERPASVVFFEAKESDDSDVILTFAPFVAEQVANRPNKANVRIFIWNIVVSGGDVQEIQNTSARHGDSLTWKIAMWGTSRDRRLLERIDAQFANDTFESLLQAGIGQPHEGVQLRHYSAASKEPIEHHPELVGRTKLHLERLRNVGRIFAFPPSVLDVIGQDECYVRKGRAKLPISVSTPPHIIVDASRRFAVFSDEFIAVPSRQIGISGTPDSADALRALSLYLCSDFVRYHQFFHAPKWGIDESIADLNTLRLLPIPIGRLSATELADWAGLQRELFEISARSHEPNGLTTREQTHLKRLIRELNNRVFKLLGLRPIERWLVEDFVQLHLALNKGKVTPDSLRQPTTSEQQTYLTSLRDGLDGFLSTERGLQHRIDILLDHESAMLSISLERSKHPIDPQFQSADGPASRNLKSIRAQLRSKHSQWVYFDRRLKIYQGGVLYHFKPLQRLHWTRRQAVLDADDIIAETLIEGTAS